MYMSYKLAKWIENEFDRNAWFFSEFKGGLHAACDFIDYVFKDNNNINLDKDDLKYIQEVRFCYSKLKSLSNDMIKTIDKYKRAYIQLFADEECIPTENGYEVRERKIQE